MVLSDKDLKLALEDGSLVVTPLTEGAIQAASIDLHLDAPFRRFNLERIAYHQGHLDLGNLPENHTVLNNNHDNRAITLLPHECVLMTTKERVVLSDGLAAQVDGKSSLGRLFQSVHITAGWIDPGFDGQITLEVVNHAPVPVIYHPGMPIAQLVVLRTTSPVEQPYSKTGRYQKQVGPVESRYTIPSR